jgi:hypothetical protein
MTKQTTRDKLRAFHAAMDYIACPPAIEATKVAQHRLLASLRCTRVELSPSTDWWMKGARYGTIVRAGRTYMHVKLDANDRVVRVHGDLLQPVGCDRPRGE